MDGQYYINGHTQIQYMYNNLFLTSVVACMCDKMLHLNTEQQRLEQVMEAMLTFKTTKSFEEINDACLF